ncbi:hypothetical protein AAE02nite_45680 [Adhaeribacter aerolatus]|uniref:PNPLA domain-containing protein n=1 Tax=Adhaeribacter aerolatus TaxID=670289 RepID=A0A512B4J7_9BACT|nr:patatin-like phospholipase family protein [Adhaeribacter aerolatus]GEO06904.1 hypothetical protein AAE02nite_45680 [Adhaeribacter aerolatus]
MKKYGLLVVLLYLIAAFESIMAQSPIYKNLVLEGGGIRGIAYGGALAELNDRAMLVPIQRVGGTSAGAIQAALFAVGYSPEEITRITFKTPVQQFTDGRLFFLGGFSRLINQFGWYRGEKFRKWLEERLHQKTGTPHITFEQLHNLHTQGKARDLYVLGTNLTKQEPVVFSYETYPHMKVSDAVRISMSIPLYFRAVFLDQAGNLVKKPGNRSDVDVMVDGGILANFPISLFDHPRYMGIPAPDSVKLFNAQTLGIRLDTDEQIKYDQQGAGLAPYQINNFKDYVRAFYAIVLEGLNRQQLAPEDWNRTISVSTKGYGERIRRLTEKDKDILLESGRQGVQAFLQKQALKP